MKSREELKKELAQEMADSKRQPSVADLLEMILDLRVENQRLAEDVNEVRDDGFEGDAGEMPDVN